MKPTEQTPRFAYTIEQFSAASQTCRTKLYEEIASGRLATYKVGRRRYLSAQAAAEWQISLEAETAAARTGSVALAAV